MAFSDLVTKKSVMELLQTLFMKYKMAFKPEGNLDYFGFSAEVPQAIQAMVPEYDPSKVVESIKNGQALNIPHQGYCMNKDVAIQLVKEGWKEVSLYDRPEEVSDELDHSINFLRRFSFCEKCVGRDCVNCGRYKAKKDAIIGINFYRQAEEMKTRIAYLRENATSIEEKKCYEEVETMLNEACSKALDGSGMV